MLKIENTEVLGWEHAIHGMRNPMNRLRNAGTDHRKFMRMITVYVDLTGPLYWWKEFDTYKVGTVANSCSTMHKIAAKEFTLEDFSYEHLIDKEVFAYPLGGGWRGLSPIEILNATIELLNNARKYYLSMEKQKVPKASEKAKEIWWQMIQLLPSSYNQRRTVMLNYEVLANIYKSRRNHKLDEWHTFCDWIEDLPYSKLIMGPSLKDIPISNEIMEEAKRRVREELNAQWDKFYEMHSGHKNADRAVFRIRKEDVDAETWGALMKATQEGKSFHIFEEDKPSENCSDGACDIKW